MDQERKARISSGEEREKEALEQCIHGGTAITGGEEVTGVRGTGATGHGLPIREHLGREDVHATSSRLRTGLEDAAGAGVAMAGGESTWPHVKRALEAMKQEINCTGR